MHPYFSFDAKIGRLEFALTTLGAGFLSSCVSICCDTSYYNAYTGQWEEGPLDPLAGIIALLLLVGLVYWQVLTCCKRLNDVHRSRWMVLWCLVPLANFVLWLYLCFKPGVLSQQNAQRQPLGDNPDIQTHTFESKFKSDFGFEKPKNQPKDNFSQVVADIERLGEMHQKGLLTDEEFATLKKKLLDN